MAVANTVEATLVSKYVDNVSKGIERTEQIARQQMSSMIQAAASFGTATSAAFETAVSGVKRWGDSLRAYAETADSQFKKTSLGAAAMAVGIVASLALVAKSILSFLVEKARAASELTELKLAFEGLAQASNWNIDTLGRLKKVTEGLVSSTEILRNSNRVMQSGVRVSSDMYVELTSNVFRLAKSAGKDGAQAMSILTDALIKGNARGFQAIGLHLAVKDAISDMAAAAGASATSLGSAATMQAFYQELVEKTRAAVAKLPEDFISLEDAITRTEKVWEGFFNKIGEGVNRSGVLQELLKRAMDALDHLAASKGEVEAIALSTNRTLIESLRVAATVMEAVGWIATGVKVLFGALKLVINFLALEIVWTAARIGNVFLTLIDLLAKLPGSAGRFFSGLADSFRTSVDYFDEASRQFGDGVRTAFDDVGNVQSHLDGMAAGSRALASDLEKFAKVVVTAKSGLQAHGDAAAGAAVDQKKFTEAVKEYEQMRRELVRSTLDSELRVYDEYFIALKKLNDNLAATEAQKHETRLLLTKKYAKEMLRVQQEAHEKALARAKELEEPYRILAELMTDVTKLPAAPNYQAAPANLGDDPGYRAIREAELRRRDEFQRIQSAVSASVDKSAPKYYRDLRAALEELNGLSLNPFKATLQLFRDNIVQIGTDITTSWGQFMADLVSGQENAGKKFLAAVVQIFAKELMVLAVRHTHLAISAAATGAWAAAARHAAAAAALAAGSGLISGLASSMAQTNQAGSAASFQENVPRPTSQAVQVIQVGAAGRSQSAGAATVNPTSVKHEVIVKLDKGLIAQEAAKDIRNNGVLRVAVVGASA